MWFGAPCVALCRAVKRRFATRSFFPADSCCHVRFGVVSAEAITGPRRRDGTGFGGNGFGCDSLDGMASG